MEQGSCRNRGTCPVRVHLACGITNKGGNASPENLNAAQGKCNDPVELRTKCARKEEEDEENESLGGQSEWVGKADSGARKKRRERGRERGRSLQEENDIFMSCQ
ncbi:hypothetical protein KM043_010061 [Ampulex compressa]|nr:hypothetical protein KM043_010061 [Ampulex compressa]